MKKVEIIEILKETIYIDGNRGTHQYWITGIEKAADRLTEQPEVAREERMKQGHDVEEFYKDDPIDLFQPDKVPKFHPTPEISEEEIEKQAKIYAAHLPRYFRRLFIRTGFILGECS